MGKKCVRTVGSRPKESTVGAPEGRGLRPEGPRAGSGVLGDGGGQRSPSLPARESGEVL